MSTKNPGQIILAPVVTEKSLAAQQQGVYSFWVTLAASKHQIEQAFFTVFGIRPLATRTVSILGKVKSNPRNRLPIKKSDRKKAYITVAKDQKIELLNLNTK